MTAQERLDYLLAEAFRDAADALEAI